MPGSGLQRPCGEHSPLPPGHRAESPSKNQEGIREKGVPQVWGGHHQAGPASTAYARGVEGRTAAGSCCFGYIQKGRHPGDGGPHQLSL